MSRKEGDRPSLLSDLPMFAPTTPESKPTKPKGVIGKPPTEDKTEAPPKRVAQKGAYQD